MDPPWPLSGDWNTITTGSGWFKPPRHDDSICGNGLVTNVNWLSVACTTVAADVDLDDAMFLDRRHEHEDSDNKVYVEDDDPPV